MGSKQRIGVNIAWSLIFVIFDSTISIMTVLVQLPATLSMLGSFSVVLTVIVFPVLVSYNLIMQVLVLISISDMLGEIVFVMGIYPDNESPACIFQGFMNSYFFPVSWLYTTALAYILKGLIIENKIVRIRRFFLHGACLGIPFVLTLLGLSTNGFGVMPENKGNYICTYGGACEEAFIWQSLNFYAVLYICTIAIIVFISEIFSWSWSQSEIATASASRTYALIRDTLFLYVASLLICWLPLSFNFFFNEGTYKTDSNWFKFYLFLRNSYGIAITIIFFWKCGEARRKWLKLLFNVNATMDTEDGKMDEVVGDDAPVDDEGGVTDRYGKISSSLF